MDSKVKKHRPVNGQLNIKRVIERVGSTMHQVHQDMNILDKFEIIPAKERIAQAGGGFIKDKHPNHATFEALVSKIVTPSSVKHKKKKAQWSRESADKILQVRTSLASNQWKQD